MSKVKNFEYLGQTFQLQLLNQIIVDKDFARSILDVIEPSYFDNKYFKTLIQLIKEYYKKYDCTPSFDTLEQQTKSEFPNETMLKILMDTINQVKNSPFEGSQFVQEKALCKVCDAFLKGFFCRIEFSTHLNLLNLKVNSSVRSAFISFSDASSASN